MHPSGRVTRWVREKHIDAKQPLGPSTLNGNVRLEINSKINMHWRIRITVLPATLTHKYKLILHTVSHIHHSHITTCHTIHLHLMSHIIEIQHFISHITQYFTPHVSYHTTCIISHHMYHITPHVSYHTTCILSHHMYPITHTTCILSHQMYPVTHVPYDTTCII